jgi:hypothetical protein
MMAIDILPTVWYGDACSSHLIRVTQSQIVNIRDNEIIEPLVVTAAPRVVTPVPMLVM